MAHDKHGEDIRWRKMKEHNDHHRGSSIEKSHPKKRRAIDDDAYDREAYDSGARDRNLENPDRKRYREAYEREARDRNREAHDRPAYRDAYDRDGKRFRRY